ncbi:MAG: EscU/YscU/HrcU family type III secretion system export apparatus switch protein [Deltaproteobacteria bacterium]|nr:EscU/YscU/HrcU family type III secretion system export apparatus switch protein [Deltaproteobacteria bacterium]
MAENQQDRTEKATPRKRQKAREKGQVPKSRDLIAIGNMGGILLVFYYGITPFWEKISGVTTALLSLQYGRDPFLVFRMASFETIRILVPFFLVIVVASIGLNLLQGGLVFKPLQLEFKKLNPLSGFKNIYSTNGFTESMKNLVKFLVGAFLIYHFIRKSLELFPLLMNLEMMELAKTAGHLILRAFVYGFFFYLVLAILDYFLQKRKFDQSLRMSKYEIKEEAKEVEGNPLIKSRLRSLQREMARRRMMEEVPKAAVIITNPQHLAIALHYRDKEMAAPKIVAKGADLVAQRIKELGRKSGIPIVEDKPLARVLFKLELNTYIPPDLYKAVAKIIAHIYKMKKIA